MSAFPWPVGAATGIGSLPGDDPDEACRVVVGELPDLPHLPELPARGAGGDLVGRTAALLVDLHVDLQPSGWRLVDRRGRDEIRARELLARDLDALEVALLGYRGPVKVQVAGPWTLAATVELTRLDKVVADHGARRDLAQSLAAGVAEHAAEVARRVPGGHVVVQVDEPALPAVLEGSIPTASGFGRLRAVQEPEAIAALSEVLAAAGEAPVVHCCAGRVPVDLVRRAGAHAVSLDLGLLHEADLEALGSAVDAGLALWLGVVPSIDPVGREPGEAEVRARVDGFWRRLGFGAEQAVARTVLTPTCGLAGASPTWARRAYALAVRAARTS